ncbi:MAG: hypothetical protein RIS64_4019 [Bacteroidota bacterium]|jgi:hypothetical protein
MKKLYFSFYFVMSHCRHKIKVLMLFTFALNEVQAQIYTLKVEPQEVNEILALKENLEIPTFEIQGLTNTDIEKLRAEDVKRAQQGEPQRVAVPIQARINTTEQGTWINLGNKKVWLLEVRAKNATQMAPIFNNLNLKSGSEIWIFTANKTLLMGPITSENIPQNVDRTVTDFLPAEAITIVYFTDQQADLTISGINFGYEAGFGSAAACNVDASSSQGDCFKFEQKAVAVLLNDDDHGSAQCTGTMINNTMQDFRPFLLTANHCFDGGLVNPSSMRVRFKWQTGITIQRNVSGRTVFEGHVTFIGANLRARSQANADFALIELFTQPQVNHDVTYLGWSRTATPQVSTILHHPAGDFMKITRDAQPATQTTNNSEFGDRGWKIALQGGGDFGVTQGGSSGASLLNENHLVCGQNFGGELTDCNQVGERTKDYGRFGVSWNGDGTMSSRLSDFLASNGSVEQLTPTFQLTGTKIISCKGVKQTIGAPNLVTSTGISYDYKWVTSPNLKITGAGNQIQVEALSDRPFSYTSTEFVSCEIRTPQICGGLLVGHSRLNLQWDSGLKLLNNGSAMSQVTFICLNRTRTFLPVVEGGTSQTRLSWTINSAGSGVSFFAGSTFLDVNFYLPTSLYVTLTATTPISATQNCVTQRSYVIVGSGTCYSGFSRENPVDGNANSLTVSETESDRSIISDFAIYPNPVTGHDVFIELPKTVRFDTDVIVKVSDLSGKVLYESKMLDQRLSIDTQYFNNGIYTISILSKEDLISKKLVIQH